MSKLQKTTDYKKFKFMKGQRPVNMTCPESKALLGSMKDYGFLPSFPIMARPNGSPTTLEIVDGQHRFVIAQELGLPVYYVIDSSDVNVTLVNKAQRKWSPNDYAESYASQGIDSYQTLMDYHHSFGISITNSASILANTMSFANTSGKFFSGSFKVTNGQMANKLGMSYRDICNIAPQTKKSAFVSALWACWHVDYFKPDQLIDGITKRPKALDVGGGRSDILGSIEDCYNFQRKDRKPLKFDAEQAMKNKNPAGKKGA